MAKGFGIAALVFAIIAIFIPFGIYVSIIAVVFAVISAFAGDRIFATATSLIVLINTFAFSPSTWLQLASDRPGLVIGVTVGAILPFVAMALKAVGNYYADKRVDGITDRIKAAGVRNTSAATGGAAGASGYEGQYSPKSAEAAKIILGEERKDDRVFFDPPEAFEERKPWLDERVTVSQGEAIKRAWKEWGWFVVVVILVALLGFNNAPLSWKEYVKQKWNQGREGYTHDGSSTVPTVPVDIGPNVQLLLGTAGRVQGVRIVTADQIPTTVHPGGPTAVGNDVRNGMHYVCYLADVSTCEAAFRQEANIERAEAGNGSTSDVTTGQQVYIPQSQSPAVEVPTDTPAAPPQQNAWNNAEEPPSYQAPITPLVEEKHWDHNGSSLKLEANNQNQRFIYVEPREGLREVGVTQGMVAFEGRRTGKLYTGTAYVFSKVCGAIGYPVNGVAAPDERSVTLQGFAPYVDPQCRRIGGRPGILVFQLVESPQQSNE